MKIGSTMQEPNIRDMRKHLRRWIDDALLRQLGDRYEGVITSVVEKTLRNRYTCTRELQPVIEFEDGLQLVPNITMRRTLIEFFGTDADEWIGRRIVVYRHRVEHTDPDTRAVRERFEKRVMRPEADVAALTGRRGSYLRPAVTERHETPAGPLASTLTADDIPWAGEAAATGKRR